jgi:hypothetical protein
MDYVVKSELHRGCLVGQSYSQWERFGESFSLNKVLHAQSVGVVLITTQSERTRDHGRFH